MLIDDRQFEFDPISSICNSCKNLLNPTNRLCKAFPNGIPKKIWNSNHNHKTSINGDNEILYEKKEK